MFFIFDDLDIPEIVAAGANAAFIGCGVLSDVLLRNFIKDPQYFGPTLKASFASCALALLGRESQVHFDMLKYNASSVALLTGLFVIAGATSLAFIGIGIEAFCLY